jgi:hypothetical protein
VLAAWYRRQRTDSEVNGQAVGRACVDAQGGGGLAHERRLRLDENADEPEISAHDHKHNRLAKNREPRSDGVFAGREHARVTRSQRPQNRPG